VDINIVKKRTALRKSPCSAIKEGKKEKLQKGEGNLHRQATAESKQRLNTKVNNRAIVGVSAGNSGKGQQERKVREPSPCEVTTRTD